MVRSGWSFLLPLSHLCVDITTPGDGYSIGEPDSVPAVSVAGMFELDLKLLHT